MINKKGLRSGVAMILFNDENKLFWGRRVGQNAWQFPQGGLQEQETAEEAMYRELYEEVGLKPEHVELVAQSKDWLRYRLPDRFIRHHSLPLCVGQRQRWFLLRLVASETHLRFDITNSPEFDGFRWVDYWFPLKEVIAFKRKIYQRALREFESVLFPHAN